MAYISQEQGQYPRHQEIDVLFPSLFIGHCRVKRAQNQAPEVIISGRQGLGISRILGAVDSMVQRHADNLQAQIVRPRNPGVDMGGLDLVNKRMIADDIPYQNRVHSGVICPG